ncbi:putative d-lactate dehydrogenase [Rosellinia necatrix]|uniref:Putative d-lactate dehydrogenase n=1 Tax=Rosellinia necatrix TaxID=77044 RepID=A0A1S7ULD6_ROSNE|nr:putative d-lactate dehydrogenase [Rosellinia necatrix]
MASLYTSLQDYLYEQQSTTNLLLPDSYEYLTALPIEQYQATQRQDQPALIARPRNAYDVQVLVLYCRLNNVEFAVRTGGNDYAGNTETQNLLWIDMHDIDYVDVAEDGTTANVGGGILFRGLTQALAQEGLVNPAGTIANVGYAGWAMLGGYGPFSAVYGLGADQVVGAKVVDSDAELVEVGNEALDGLMSGDIFGVIVELTIKYISRGS